MKVNFFDFILLTMLRPLSFIWDWVYRLRRFLFTYKVFHQEEFRVPIISIGNLTFGGTGKTPLSLWLAEYFAEMNKRVMILSRGYRGKMENSNGILKSGTRLGFNPVEYGDEASLLALRLENASIVVGRNRAENLEYYYDKEKPDVVLLDDGHQHLKLRRNLNIVLFDCLMPLNRYRVAPSGYMREGFYALKDADVIILGRSDQVSRDKIDQLKELIQPHLRPQTLITEIRYMPVGLYDTHFREAHNLEVLKGRKVIALAGLASPLSFYRSLETLGAELISRNAFPDHHYFKEDEISSLLQLADKENALLITTEKDMVKLRRLIEDDRLLYLKIDVDFMKGESKFKQLIENVTSLDQK